MQSQKQKRRHSKRNKIIILVVALILMIAGFCCIWIFAIQPHQNNNQSPQDNASIVTSPDNNNQSSTTDNSQNLATTGNQILDDSECATEISYIPDYVTEDVYASFVNEYSQFNQQVNDTTSMTDEDLAALKSMQEKLKTYEDFQSLYAVKRTLGRYICLKATNLNDGIGIKIPENFDSIEYGTNYTGEFKIYGVTKDGKNYNLRNYGLPDSLYTGLSFMEVVDLSKMDPESVSFYANNLYHANGRIGLVNNPAARTWASNWITGYLPGLGTLSEEEALELNQIIDEIQTMLTSQNNYFALK